MTRHHVKLHDMALVLSTSLGTVLPIEVLRRRLPRQPLPAARRSTLCKSARGRPPITAGCVASNQDGSEGHRKHWHNQELNYITLGIYVKNVGTTFKNLGPRIVVLCGKFGRTTWCGGQGIGSRRSRAAEYHKAAGRGF